MGRIGSNKSRSLKKIFISEIPKPSAAPKATEIKSSANKEGERLIEYIALQAPSIDIT